MRQHGPEGSGLWSRKGAQPPPPRPVTLRAVLHSRPGGVCQPHHCLGAASHTAANLLLVVKAPLALCTTTGQHAVARIQGSV